MDLREYIDSFDACFWVDMLLLIKNYWIKGSAAASNLRMCVS